MSSTHQLKMGYCPSPNGAIAQWIRHNQEVSRDVKVLQSSFKNGCRYLSVCYSAPDTGWRNTDYGCRAHLNIVGKSLNECNIVSMQLQHTCEASESQRKRQYKSDSIAKLSEAVAMYQPTARREGNAKQVTEIARASTGLKLGRSQAYRLVHQRSNDTIHAQIGQYMLLPGLFEQLNALDPDGTHLLESVDCPWNDTLKQFKRCYISLSFMKHFWVKSGIRMIVIDGTHTKLEDFKHILLIAVTFDGNNEVVILSFAVVEVENKDNWVWFHSKLQEDFPNFEVIMSDADKGITSEDFRLSQDQVDALTSRCARHLAENCREACKFKMNAGHKGLIISLAKCRTEESYLNVLNKIRAVHHEWADWLDERKYEFAAYTFLQRDVRRWGKATSNAVENINSSLVDVRNLPIYLMITGIVEKIQSKYLRGYNKAKELRDPKKKQAVTDYAWDCHKKLVKGAIKRKVFLTSEQETCFTGKVSRGDPNSVYPRFVEVSVWPEELHHNCPCKFFQEEGLTCEHVIALLRTKNISTLDKWWFAQRYHSYTYFASYSAEVPALAISEIEPDVCYAPPDHKKPAGRPPKARKDRSWMNKTDRLNKCGSCGGLGHSYRTCQNPSTQFRFEYNYARAVAWAKNFSCDETD